MPEWEVEIDGEPEPNLFYITVNDTANPWGNVAILSIHDQNGTRFDAYEIGKPVDIYIVPPGQEQDLDTLQVDSGETYEVEEGTTDRYADISHVHDVREQPEHIGTRAIPEDLQAL